MSDFKQQYKNPRPGYLDHSRILRAYKHVESRKEVRTRAFHDNRNLQSISVPASQQSADVPILNRRTRKFLKWKESKKRRRKLALENAKKKHAFKAVVIPIMNRRMRRRLKWKEEKRRRKQLAIAKNHPFKQTQSNEIPMKEKTEDFGSSDINNISEIIDRLVKEGPD